MYYHQYNMYKGQGGWCGYPQAGQYLSPCMHEEETWLSGGPSGAPPPPEVGQIQLLGGTEGLVPGVIGAQPAGNQQHHEIWPEQHHVISPHHVDPGAQQRLSQPRSPYEWMKKPSYQSQPTPDYGTMPNQEDVVSPDRQDDLPSEAGKTRTKDKYRVVYTDHQRLELEKEFHYSKYITIRRKAELASFLGLSERQVKIWFQNRRAKDRKQVKKMGEMVNKEKMQQLAMM